MDEDDVFQAKAGNWATQSNNTDHNNDQFIRGDSFGFSNQATHQQPNRNVMFNVNDVEH
ncbi:MAG: hypothetical protein ACMG6E_05095 [Candidatus Roizmanbacteria bacterium]